MTSVDSKLKEHLGHRLEGYYQPEIKMNVSDVINEVGKNRLCLEYKIQSFNNANELVEFVGRENAKELVDKDKNKVLVKHT